MPIFPNVVVAIVKLSASCAAESSAKCNLCIFAEFFLNSNIEGKKGYTYPNPMVLDQVLYYYKENANHDAILFIFSRVALMLD